jgi:hypothetical protein
LIEQRGGHLSKAQRAEPIARISQLNALPDNVSGKRMRSRGSAQVVTEEKRPAAVFFWRPSHWQGQ